MVSPRLDAALSARSSAAPPSSLRAGEPHLPARVDHAARARWALVLVLGAGVAFGAFALRSERPRSLPVSASAPAAPVRAERPLPRLLSETGLYVVGDTTRVDPNHLFFVPQYPLWSDGATKRRWIALPEGEHIDATQADAWQFPIGTRLWKEFSFGDQRVETRYIERAADGSFRYASYVWDAALGDAVLAPELGLAGVVESRPGVRHDIPARADCQACHEGRSTPVLGFGALQLSSDRDPLAAHREPAPLEAVDLAGLVRRGLLANFATDAVEAAPRIHARSPVARAALGYLFGNCANCHNARGPLAELGLDFDQSVRKSADHERALRSTLGRASHFRIPGERDSLRIAAAHPERSTVWFRMRSREPAAQMPPLGTRIVDEEGVRLLEQWISADL